MANLSRTGVAGWSIRQLFIQHSTCTVFVFPVYYYPIHQYLFFSDQEDIKKTPSLGVRAFVFFSASSAYLLIAICALVSISRRTGRMRRLKSAKSNLWFDISLIEQQAIGHRMKQHHDGCEEQSAICVLNIRGPFFLHCFPTKYVDFMIS